MLVFRFLLCKEVCGDGVERVIMRTVCTKLHPRDRSLAGDESYADQFVKQSALGVEHCGVSMYQHVKRCLDRLGTFQQGVCV